jgi:uncharacterized protein (DUF1697 family)
MRTDTFIALFRGINVTGHNKISMPELRALCADLGWPEVQSYIQSGNLVLKASTTRGQLETTLEQAVARRFDLSIPVIARTARDWAVCVRENPYPEESRSEPNRVMLALAKASPRPNAAEQLRKRAADGERILQVGDALWIHYAAGVARSKLSPGLLDRVVGSPVTIRNWRTVCKLAELASAVPEQR